ncbi:glycine-rich domain-containing protein [Candidatus Accumulibacter necessarius]|uniref:glycine-rich domain-containing protein n=1 Tax=Candidatus Accumulibacter necessarius TaxID=2954386 RepID=UPI003DA7CF0F
MIKLVILLMVIGLIAAAIVWWRALIRQREGFIDRYPYAKFLDRRLAARRPELSEAQRELVFDGLREYFQLCRESRKRLVAMPSQVVDDAWHEFILFTRQYQQFCERGLGRFLHHTPAAAMRSPTDAQDGIKRAWRLACQRDGIDPQSPQSLPLLFALDAMLGIAGGFVYQLDCLAAVQAGAGTGFCAGHIGCGGGGCSGGDGDGSAGDGCSGGGCGGD